MTEPSSQTRLTGPAKRRLAVLLLTLGILLVSLAWLIPPAQADQGPAVTATPGPAFVLTPTLNPIPELNPNPRQTDGVILGAAVIIAVIVAGVWTYGRKRKE